MRAKTRVSSPNSVSFFKQLLSLSMSSRARLLLRSAFGHSILSTRLQLALSFTFSFFSQRIQPCSPPSQGVAISLRASGHYNHLHAFASALPSSPLCQSLFSRRWMHHFAGSLTTLIHLNLGTSGSHCTELS